MLAQGFLDLLHYLIRRLVFPDSENSPAGGDEDGPILSISDLVAIELGRPPFSIGRWAGCMLRTAVPKAAVDKDGQLLTRKYDVRLTANVRYGSSVLTES
jgi:hypothetical protein